MTGIDAIREHEQLYEARLRHLVPVREPLVLVSQVQRSGGTLLSQLFDGHPEVHPYPHELSMTWFYKPRRGAFDLCSAAACYEQLVDVRLSKRLRTGYRKPATNSQDPDADVYPFLFLGGLQRAIFERCFGDGLASDRAVLDAWFTATFNAWLDDQSLYSGPKRAVTAFAPRLARKEHAVGRLFSAYPDGFLISIVREPRGWFASVRTQKERYADVDHAIERWRRSAEAALDARERWGDRVLALTYDGLVGRTEETMERVAGRIGLSMSPTLLTPTFNGRPIRANSSHAVEGYGVLRNRAGRRADLDDETAARVDALAGDLYERAQAAEAG